MVHVRFFGEENQYVALYHNKKCKQYLGHVDDFPPEKINYLKRKLEGEIKNGRRQEDK